MGTPSEYVVALDPGQRCGIAYGTVSEGKLEVDRAYVLPLKEAAIWLAQMQLTSGREGGEPLFSTIVFETWRLHPAKAKALIGDDMQPSQLIGMIRLIGWISQATLYAVGPDRKFVASTALAEFLDPLKAQSNEEHDKDALDLLAYYAYEEWDFLGA